MNRPIVSAHAGGKAHGKPNSVDAILATSHHKPDMIELDLRKSRDGVLYCHHGIIPLAEFWRLFSFKTIKKLLKVDTFQDVLKAIDSDKILYIDIKQRNINAKDIKQAFEPFHFKTIWIAAFSLKYLDRVKKGLGDKFKYVYNFGFFLFNHSLKRAKEIGIDMHQIFFWQCTDEHLKKIKAAGLDYTLNSYPLSRMKYERLAKKINSYYIYYGNLEEGNQRHNQH